MALSVDPFETDTRLDERGILITRLSGAFDVDAWARRREEFVSRDHPDLDMNRRPVVSDIRDLIGPPADWTDHAEGIRRYERERGFQFGRNAFVTGGKPEAETIAHFFIEYTKAKYDGAYEVKAFVDFDEAYAWASEGYVPHDA